MGLFLIVAKDGNLDAARESASERKVVAMMITKEEVMEALNAGRVTCNLKGNVSSFSPQKARDFLLDNLDQILGQDSRVDLSFEKRYEDMLG